MPRLVSSCLLVLLALTPATTAWVSSSTQTRSRTTQLQSHVSTNSQPTRKAFLQTVAATGLTTLVVGTATPALAAAEETLPNGVTYSVIKSGNGPKPDLGELVAIRFAAYNGDIKIDDIFDTPEPYYTRLGSGGLLKGVEETLPLMRLGDRWKLTIPVGY